MSRIRIGEGRQTIGWKSSTTPLLSISSISMRHGIGGRPDGRPGPSRDVLLQELHRASARVDEYFTPQFGPRSHASTKPTTGLRVLVKIATATRRSAPHSVPRPWEVVAADKQRGPRPSDTVGSCRMRPTYDGSLPAAINGDGTSVSTTWASEAVPRPARHSRGGELG